MVPLVSRRKKPLPLIAMSSGLFVVVMLPCVNSAWIPATATPMPAPLPPDPPMELAKTSANSACEPLKPMVFELATLLPMTSRLRAAALRPDSPCWKPMGAPCQLICLTLARSTRPSPATCTCVPLLPGTMPVTLPDVSTSRATALPPIVAVALIE